MVSGCYVQEYTWWSLYSLTHSVFMSGVEHSTDYFRGIYCLF